MKKILSTTFIFFILIIIYLVYSNSSLYNNMYNFIDKKQLIVRSNKEKFLYLKNKNKSNIYNLYILNNKYKLDNIKIYVNNKLIDNNYIKNNNYIIYSLIIKKKDSKVISIRIDSNNNDDYLVGINAVRKDISLTKLIKNKSLKKTYHIDTDSAKELYRINRDYKYVGKVPNNYLYFNCKNNNLLSCELYRIIGITKKGIKIIKNHPEKYDNNQYNIYESNKELVYTDKIDVLSLDDYIDSYKFVNNKCAKSINNCNKKSYLTPIKNEIIKHNNKMLIISNKGKISKGKATYYRPVLFLKKNVVVLGGNGSYNMPYYLKFDH